MAPLWRRCSIEAGQPLCLACAQLSDLEAARSSGRVGRTAAGRDLQQGSLTAAVAAAIRHNHTDYDALLAAGLDRTLARERVAARVSATLEAWRE